MLQRQISDNIQVRIFDIQGSISNIQERILKTKMCIVTSKTAFWKLQCVINIQDRILNTTMCN